jgi:SAM-dependent methyltransferase
LIACEREDIVKNIVAEFDNILGDNSKAFLKRVYNTPRERYADRLKAIGFYGFDSVLDAGCGFGQWALELALNNRSVSAIDISSERLIVLKYLIQKLGIDNIRIRRGDLTDLPYKAESFDAIFCYSVIFLTPWKESLAEFRRILRGGGKLYLNANGLGYYIHLWKNSPNKADDYNPREVAAEAFCNTTKYQRGLPPKLGADIIITPDEMREELADQGFEIIDMGDEGTINLYESKLDIVPNFRGSYEGEAGVYEFLAKKLI